MDPAHRPLARTPVRAAKIVEALIREDLDEPAPERNAAGGISPEKLLGFLQQYIDEGATGVTLTSDYGDVQINAMEVWKQGGVIMISVSAKPSEPERTGETVIGAP